MNQSIFEAYKWGDRTGLPFEGGGIFPGSVNEELLQHAAKSIQGSDESSIVDCFTAFTRTCQYTGTDQFVWDWCRYHQQHHGTGYGKTYRDHFQLVKHIDRHPEQYPDLQSRIGKLKEIALDANSFGNGCLAIVYPAYCYAQSIGEQPVAFVRHLVSFTHAHDDALQAVTLLCSFIEQPETIPSYSIADDEEFRQRYCKAHATAYNTLMTAAKCAVKDGYMDVAQEAVRISGDTDSVLATAMLLWCLLQGGTGMPEALQAHGHGRMNVQHCW